MTWQLLKLSVLLRWIFVSFTILIFALLVIPVGTLMGLCATCKNIDYRAILITSLQQCRDRQEATKNGVLDETERSPEKWKHHDDIFEIQKSARDCALCKAIFEAFEEQNIANQELARGLPIILRGSGKGVEVCYDTAEGLIRVCGFEVCMNGPDVIRIFKLCEIKEDHSPPILKIMEKNSGSKGSLRIASNWLKDCLNNHSSCKRASKLQQPPKRLINVGNDSENPSLEETDPNSKQMRWLSLSYCWGDKRSMMLTQCTRSQLMDGTIPVDKFDPAIRDAILVSRALEIHYIWIDALCIFQDDNGKDWNEQASKMNEIYGGSDLTLVVASSDSVMNRFLNERDLQYIQISQSSDQPGESASSDLPTKVFLLPEWDKRHDEIGRPWNTRGWTMQEGFLPNRLLYFQSSQIIWKCCEERKFERGVTESLQGVIDEHLAHSDDIAFDSGWIWNLDTFMIFKRLPDFLPFNFDSLSSAPEIFRLWYDLIEDYTLRKFTCISDRLVAISGLAHIFGNMIRSREYVSGLWKLDMIRGLLWYTEGANLIPRRSEERMKAQNSFPSWSWASVGYERVKFSQKHNSHTQSLSRIEDEEVDFHDQFESFGAVNSKSITIAGPLKRLSRLYNPSWRSAEEPMSELERHLSEITENESSGSVDPRYSSPSGLHFAALQMLGDVHGKINLLVLESTGNVSNGHNEYYRVGVVTLQSFSPRDVASPELLAQLRKFDESLSARLGPQRNQPRKQKISNVVVAELRREPWKIETVVII